MPQIFYVAQDEEILSIVGRLRSSPRLENVFVVPKRALVLGSVVNLRLLAREAEKAGKQVLIVTQDETGRVLAEKAGVPTRPYSDEFMREDISLRQQHHVAPPSVVQPVGSDGRHAPSSDSLGSSGFFTDDARTDGIRSSKTPAAVRIPVAREPVAARRTAEGVSDLRSASRPAFREADVPAGRLARVFDASKPGPSRSDGTSRHRHEDGAVRMKPNPSAGTKKHPWFIFFASVSILFLIATAAILLLPKAKIAVIPKSVSKNMEIDFQGKVGVASDREVPVRIIAFEQDVSVTVETSGSASSDGQKASGTVIISNASGTGSQQLVATTRLESGDGKIFRLTKGVVVPGMTERDGKKEPGIVEAAVVADGVGSAYDIGPSEFTIPGFKGTAKYASITAKSTSSMKGGAAAGASGTPTVSDADVSRAKQSAEETFLNAFREQIETETGDDERFVEKSFSVAIVGSPSHPETGFATTTFEYRARFSGKAFAFSESELKRKASELLAKNAALVESYTVSDVTFEYLGGVADFETGEYPIPVRATALFMADVDTGSLRNDLLGKRMDEVQSVLDRYPDVSKVEIAWPFPTSLPSKPGQIEIAVQGT